MLTFITGSKEKFAAAETFLGKGILERLEISLDEIQEMDPHKIIAHKLEEAFKHHSGPFLVEDTSLYLSCLKGFPGPLVKWFFETIGGNEGVVDLVKRLGDDKVIAKCMVSYAKSPDEVQFFEGEVHGRIVSPRGTNDWGWGLIFQPDGFTKTFAEMTPSEKELCNHRALAMKKLKEFLK